MPMHVFGQSRHLQAATRNPSLIGLQHTPTLAQSRGSYGTGGARRMADAVDHRNRDTDKLY